MLTKGSWRAKKKKFRNIGWSQYCTNPLIRFVLAAAFCTAVSSVCGSLVRNFRSRIWCQEFNGGSWFEWPIVNLAEPYSMYRPGCATHVNDFWTDTPVNFANHDKKQSWETFIYDSCIKFPFKKKWYFNCLLSLFLPLLFTSNFFFWGYT